MGSLPGMTRGQSTTPGRSAPLAQRLLCYAALLAGSALFLAPLAWSVSTSLKRSDQIYEATMRWIPDPIMWSNYARAMEAINFGALLGNSILVTALSILGIVFSSTLTAYSFGCLRWRGQDGMFVVLLATMMLPPQVTMIPVFIMFAKLGWIDSFLPLVVPCFIGGNAFFIFLLRQFFKTLPGALFDAARIDGCSSFGIYWRVVLPLSWPALATVILFTLNATWNDFLNPLIYLNSDNKKTLALGLQTFVSQYSAEWSQLMAVSVIMIVPIVLIFFFCQRYFIEGIAVTGMKD